MDAKIVRLTQSSSRVFRVISSCESLRQIPMAERYAKLWLKRHGIEDDEDSHRVIQYLVEAKCRVLVLFPLGSAPGKDVSDNLVELHSRDEANGEYNAVGNENGNVKE